MPDYIFSPDFWMAAFAGGASGFVLAAAILKLWIKFRFDGVIEDQKYQQQKQLEGWKAGYQKAIDEGRVRYSRFYTEQADAIKVLYTLLIEMEGSLQSLTNPLQLSPEDEAEKKKYLDKRICDCKNAIGKYRDKFEKSRIFLSEETCNLCDELVDTAIAAYVRYTEYDDCNNIQHLKMRHDAWSTVKRELSQTRKKLEQDFRKVLGHVNPS